jgi:hypothetical protein
LEKQGVFIKFTKDILEEVELYKEESTIQPYKFTIAGSVVKVDLVKGSSLSFKERKLSALQAT